MICAVEERGVDEGSRAVELDRLLLVAEDCFMLEAAALECVDGFAEALVGITGGVTIKVLAFHAQHIAARCSVHIPTLEN